MRSSLFWAAGVLAVRVILFGTAFSAAASDWTAAAPSSAGQSAASASPSSTAATGQPDLAEFEKRIARIEEQIKALHTRLDAEHQKESTVLSNLAKLNLNKSLIQRELASLAVQMQKAEAEIATIQKNVRATRADLERGNAAIESTLATLYKFGRLNYLHFLVQARNIDTYSSQSKRLALLARFEEDTIAAYQRSLESLRASESALDGKKRELAEIIRVTDLKNQELESEARKNAALVQEIQKNGRTYEQTIHELQDSADQLQVMMKRITANEWIPPAAFVPMDERKGRLDWPLDGRVITPFGPQRHPHFNTMVMNNGVEIAPRKDKSIIQSVHAGKVVYADYFEGYGNLLIVDHGLTYFSLYGHCSEFLAKVGDMVKAGQPVALVGDSGSLKGECLYFEMRHKTKPLDPLQWLKPR